MLKSLGRADLLILDDWAWSRSTRARATTCSKSSRSDMDVAPLSSRPNFLWIAGIRHRRPTYADAILDRLVHNAHRIELTGESLRRARAKQARTA